tara:strand:+ start:560 stop:1561 length:1002 start_codon:yes stop_codon:yes gene_type:complete
MKIGIFSPNWIGDAVMSLQFINRLHEEYPNDELIIVSKSWVKAVYKNHPYIDHVISFPSNKLKGIINTINNGRKLHNIKFDILYVLPDSFRSAFISSLSRAKKRIGYSGQLRNIFLTDPININKKGIHRSRKFLKLLPDYRKKDNKEYIGISLLEDEKKWAKNIFKQNSLIKPIGILSGSVAPSRSISSGKWINILQDRLAPKTEIIIIGDAAEESKAKEIISSVSNLRVISFCGKYDLRQSIALISQCYMVIAADSGLGHISADLDIPTVSLFGAGNYKITGPIGKNTDVVTANVHCSPCEKNICTNVSDPLICINNLSASKIWTANNQFKI